jgi:hypothetical protein
MTTLHHTYPLLIAMLGAVAAAYVAHRDDRGPRR